jgi:hypothetical protein
MCHIANSRKLQENSPFWIILVDIMHMPISYGTIYEHTLVMVTILTIVQFPPNLHTCDMAKDFLLGKK